MNLVDYPTVATLVGTTIVVVLLVGRFSAAVRRRLAY
jgi:ABC-type phosphate/phosphonate transport system permease subunit